MNTIIYSCSIVLIYLFSQEVISIPIILPISDELKNRTGKMARVFQCLIMHHIDYLHDIIYIRYGDIGIENKNSCSSEDELQFRDLQAKVQEYSGNCYAEFEELSNQQLWKSNEVKYNCDDVTENDDCSGDHEEIMSSLREDMYYCLLRSMHESRDFAIGILNKLASCNMKTRILKKPSTEEIDTIRNNFKNESSCPII